VFKGSILPLTFWVKGAKVPFRKVGDGDSGLDYAGAYQRTLSHLTKTNEPYDVVLLVQLRNGSRVGEAVEATLRFSETREGEVLMRVEKHRGND